jgi:hypothetical protein
MSIERSADRRVPLASPFGRQVRERGTLRGLGPSAVVHLGLLALVLWGQHRMMEAGRLPGAGPGASGGGGGGGRVFAVLALPRAQVSLPPAPALTVPSLQALTVPVDQPPEEVPVQMSADELAALIRATVPGNGAGQGSGVGPGAGSGTGGGTGSGVGSGTGPDSGGRGGNVFAPQPQGIILPPPDRPSGVRGTTVRVRFEISARGEVLAVSLDPPIRDRKFRDDFLERLRRYTFTPAYTRDGRAVPGVFEIRITL